MTWRTDHAHRAILRVNPTVDIHVDGEGQPLCEGPACREIATFLTRWERPAGTCSCPQCVTSPACALHVALWRLTQTNLLEDRVMPAGWQRPDGWPS